MQYLIPVGFILIMLLGYLWAKKSEEIEWNNGVCLRCSKGFYKCFDIDSSGAIGYKCTNCGYVTWQSYNKRKDRYNENKQ